ncbi:hypothetical protein LTR09_006817 [Extremus antarcticus]|uniref:Calcipressin n=1 Tax=Extremus antarcticus TaxID=702011 RepID=A0AAJ0GBN2_9PEZI|nr:hypothetical protein LTR09_006817 [Extremus antarcticus]
MAAVMDTPPPSTGASPSLPSRRRHSPNLSLDLSDLPPLSQPAAPSNILLITNLQAPEIFATANLESIHAALAAHAPIHTFAPLKSMRRIICTFPTTASAIKIRQLLDGEAVFGDRVRVYFGSETKILEGDQHLQAPKAAKMFFISPPPSPPMGWEMQDEAPPNTEVHAEDLAEALGKLHARPAPDEALREGRRVEGRQRSGTGTVVYDPQDHGHSPDLPAIAVEDTSVTPEEMGVGEGEGIRFTHTARPPVELMET